MLFGIIDENKKFILSDENRDILRNTALLLSENKNGEFSPMFNEDNVDSVIKEYKDSDIEIAYNGDKYIKGFTPTIDKEYQSRQREIAYKNYVDPITAHINRLRDQTQTDETVEKISELIIKRDTKVNEIKEKYPY